MAGRTLAGGRHAKTAVLVEQILFRFGRNWSIPRQWPDGPYNPMDIKLRSQRDQERSIASAAHSDTSDREIGNT